MQPPAARTSKCSLLLYNFSQTLRRLLLAGALAACLSLLSVAALFPFDQTPAHAATQLRVNAPSPLLPQLPNHAFLLRSDPPAHAILQAPPSGVRLWFSEKINPLTSRAVVVDTSNRQVDNHDSHVNSSDQHEMDLSLPPLPAGTYVVVWRNQSAEDGHIIGGSFYFQIARPDGSVPPVPPVLPTGNIPGAGGNGAVGSTTLDGPTTLQAVSTWLALVFFALWVGGLIWETWILLPGKSADPDLADASLLAAERFQRLKILALLLLLVSDLGIVLAQGAELAGEWSGMFSLTLLRAILFGSQFGTFWWLRQGVALAGLLLALAAYRYRWSGQKHQRQLPQASSEAAETEEVRPWWPALLETLRSIPHLPQQLALGWGMRSWLGRLELLLGAALLIAFALSGHAAALPSSELTYGLSVDLLHLLGNAAWVGGLFYIALMIIPVLSKIAPRQRAHVLALGLPQFSALAIVSAFTLAATGSLNTAIHLTSLDQFLTTAYGRTLTIKILLFLVMVGISAYHAFVLRPRLAFQLNMMPAETKQVIVEPEEVAAGGGSSSHGESSASVPPVPTRESGWETVPFPVQRLMEGLERWLRREALIGCVVLLCVALLAAFAGSLAVAPPTGAGAGSSSGAFLQTKIVQSYSLTLKVTPATFGTNTFVATVLDPQGQSVSNAQVLIQTMMVEMDMGVGNAQLKPLSASPGVYSGQADLTMGGHWNILLKVLPQQASQYITTTFTVPVSY